MIVHTNSDFKIIGWGEFNVFFFKYPGTQLQGKVVGACFSIHLVVSFDHCFPKHSCLINVAVNALQFIVLQKVIRGVDFSGERQGGGC